MAHSYHFYYRSYPCSSFCRGCSFHIEYNDPHAYSYHRPDLGSLDLGTNYPDLSLGHSVEKPPSAHLLHRNPPNNSIHHQWWWFRQVVNCIYLFSTPSVVFSYQPKLSSHLCHLFKDLICGWVVSGLPAKVFLPVSDFLVLQVYCFGRFSLTFQQSQHKETPHKNHPLLYPTLLYYFHRVTDRSIPSLTHHICGDWGRFSKMR